MCRRCDLGVIVSFNFHYDVRLEAINERTRKIAGEHESCIKVGPMKTKNILCFPTSSWPF